MSISVAVAFHRFACRLRPFRGLQGRRFGQRDQVQRSMNSFTTTKVSVPPAFIPTSPSV
jgi:hypothetical protein